MMEDHQRQMDNSKLSSFGCSVSKDNLIEENVQLDKKAGGYINTEKCRPVDQALQLELVCTSL